MTVITEITWDEDQVKAITAACDTARRVVAITGAAGTGKTALKKAAHDVLSRAGYSCSMIDPTGKAAKRTHEATGIPSSTHHRKCEYTHPGEPDPDTGDTVDVSFPRRDKRRPLEEDVLFCDEYAMWNHEMHRNQFDAMKPGSRIIVLGDMNQLSPIESSKKLQQQPTPFATLLKNFEGIVLKTPHRSGSGSGIVIACNSILKGIPPRSNDDFKMVFSDHPVNTLEDFLYTALDNGIDYNSIDNQVICLQHSSWVGTTKLNAQIQAIFGSGRKECIEIEQFEWKTKKGLGEYVRFYVGDKVMQTQNNYGLECYNGEIGIIDNITEFGEIEINFGDRRVSFPPEQTVVGSKGVFRADPRKALELAYAVTTHKMQGSEVQHVVYVMNKSAPFNQSRRNFYTGASRARTRCTIITDQKSNQRALNNRE